MAKSKSAKSGFCLGELKLKSIAKLLRLRSVKLSARLKTAEPADRPKLRLKIRKANDVAARSLDLAALGFRP